MTRYDRMETLAIRSMLLRMVTDDTESQKSKNVAKGYIVRKSDGQK